MIMQRNNMTIDQRDRGGQMFVGMVLLIGSVIAIITLFLLFISGSLIDTGYGIKYNAAAQAAATAGAEDALLRIDRNSLTSLPASYSVPVNGATAQVSVGGVIPGSVTVTSTATVMNHTKVVRLVVSIGADTQVSVVSWTEVQ